MENERRNPRQKLKELRDWLFSQEPERESPRGKHFTMVNGGHGPEDVPQLETWRSTVLSVLDQTPPGKKVLLYIEAGNIPKQTAIRIGQLVEEGMILSDAEAQANYEADFASPIKVSKKRIKQWREALKEEIASEKNPYDAAVTHIVDDLLVVHKDRITVVLEGQPGDIIEGNMRFKDEIEAPLPNGTRMGRLIAERREQMEEWAQTKKSREANITDDILDGMSRTDVFAGVGLQGAWHHKGVDVRLKDELRLPDDAEAENIVSVFPESQTPTQRLGTIIYPVDPQIDLLRRMMDGRDVSDLEIQLALESELIDFTHVTAEEAIRQQSNPRADAYMPDYTGDTVVINGVFPDGKTAEYWREQQLYVRLKLAMHEGTTQMPQIQGEGDVYGSTDGTVGLDHKNNEIQVPIFDGSVEAYDALSDVEKRIMRGHYPGGEAITFAIDDEARRDLYKKTQEQLAKARAHQDELRDQGVPIEDLPTYPRIRIVFQERRDNDVAYDAMRAEPKVGESTTRSILDQEAEASTEKYNPKHRKTK